MKEASDWTCTSRWGDLFVLGDQLLQVQQLSRQVALIEEWFLKLTGGRTDVRLVGAYTPLQHEKNLHKNDDSTQSGLYLSQEIDDGLTTHGEPDEFTISVPLKNARSSIGVMRIQFPERFNISQACETFLTGAGHYLANILELSHLANLKDWRQDQISLVHSVNSAIMQLNDPQALFPRIAELIQTTFHYYFVALYTIDHTGERVFLTASAGVHLDDRQRAELCPQSGIPLGSGLVGTCAQSGQEIHSADISTDQTYRGVSGLKDAQAEICLPLILGDQVLGVLEVVSDIKNIFHEKDILVLRILSDSVALAVHNSVLFNDLLEQTWVSTLLLQVTEAAQEHTSIDDLLGAVVRTIPLLIDVQRCAIFLLDSQSDEFYLNAHYGFDAGEDALLAMLPYSEEGKKSFLRCKTERIPLNIPAKLISRENEPGRPDHACCGLVPLVAHNNVYGLMLVDSLESQKNAHSRSGFSREDVFMAVCRQTALAIENLRLQESQENETYVTAILLQVAEMVAEAGDFQESIENIINLLPLVVGVDTVLIYLLDDERKRLHLQAQLSQQWKNQTNRLPLSIRCKTYGNLASLISEPSPRFFLLGTDPIESWLQVEKKQYLKEPDIYTIPQHLMIVFPLFIHDEKYGLMFIGESEDGYKYREKKIEIISGIARNLSLVIQNEQLKKEMIKQESIRREIELAREIQTTFLPENLPDITGWEFSARWRPALQVGGDFYDVFELGDGRIGLVIADVSDKGMPAALYMTVTRTLIRAESIEGRPPAEMLQSVNRLLLLNSPKGLFVTGIFAILDPNTATLTYTNAGHNRPLLLKKSRSEIVWLEKGGLPLGVSEEPGFTNHSLNFAEGDLLMLYTDGVTEAQSADGSFFGEDRLFSVLKRYQGKTSYALIDIIDAKLMEFKGAAPASDDLTILVVQRAAH